VLIMTWRYCCRSCGCLELRVMSCLVIAFSCLALVFVMLVFIMSCCLLSPHEIEIVVWSLSAGKGDWLEKVIDRIKCKYYENEIFLGSSYRFNT
jgi:hypothetical protein